MHAKAFYAAISLNYSLHFLLLQIMSRYASQREMAQHFGRHLQTLNVLAIGKMQAGNAYRLYVYTCTVVVESLQHVQLKYSMFFLSSV